MTDDSATENTALVRRSLSGAIRGTFTLRGRSTRSDVWIYGLASQVVAATLTALAGFFLAAPDKELVRQAVGLLLALPLPMLFARRMHDAGFAKAWAWLLGWPLIERLGDLIDRAFPVVPYPFLTAGPVMWIGVLGFVAGLGIVLLAPSSSTPD